MAKKPQQKPYCPNCGRVGHPKDSDLIPLGEKSISDINHIRFDCQGELKTLEELTRIGTNFTPFKVFSSMVYYKSSLLETIRAAYGNKLKVCSKCPDVALLGEKWLIERAVLGDAIHHNSIGTIKAVIKLHPDELKQRNLLPYLAMNPEPDEMVRLISLNFTPVEKAELLNKYVDSRPGISDVLKIVKFTRSWVETGIDITILKPKTMKYVIDYIPLEDQKKILARIFIDVVRAN